MRVYHLCGTQFAVSNIALRRLKISRFMDMNDPFEMWVNTKNANRRQAFLRSKAVMNEKKGCLCFSKSWRDPVYWAHYAEKHFGMALGFDIADEWLTDISYVDEPPDGDKEPDINLMRQWLLSKFTGWQYEEEVRAMVDLDPSVRQGGLYFLEFSDKLVFREIILGVR